MSLEECGAVIRSIVTRSLVESFGYDALNRLSTFGDKVVKYDNCGNIRQKGDAGELVYTNPNRPYAVTGLAPLETTEKQTKYTISFSMKTKFLHAKIILKAPNSQRIPE